MGRWWFQMFFLKFTLGKWSNLTFFFKWVVQPPTRSSEITEFVCTIQLEATVSPWKIDIRWNHHFALSLWFSIPSNMLVWNISDRFKAAVAETKPATPKLATQTEPWRAQNCCCSYWVEYLAIICNIYMYIYIWYDYNMSTILAYR